MTGFVPVTSEAYHRDDVGADVPTLSSGIASTLLNASPAHARFIHPKLNPAYQPQAEKKFDVGTASHRLLLEGVENVVVVPAPDWKTKAAREAAVEARAVGMTPLLAHQWDAVKAMVGAARRQLADFNVTPTPFTAGKPEQCIVWTEENGVVCRALIDWLHDDLSAIDDYKTTKASANPASWTRNTLYGIGADFQTAFYLRGMARVANALPDWRFVVQENYPPFALSVISLAPSVMEFANAKVERAIELWADCLSRDEWPAYPPSIAWAELPAWEESRWLEREAREEMAA